MRPALFRSCSCCSIPDLAYGLVVLATSCMLPVLLFDEEEVALSSAGGMPADADV